MRDRSYLTPIGQVVVGGIVVIACFAFPPLLIIVLLVFGGRCLRDLARRSAPSAALANALLVAAGVGLSYLLRASGLWAIVVAATLGGCVWLVATHMRARSQIEAFSSTADDPAEQRQHQLRGQ
jgi:NhaP-type Na+/H+ or K+/H+ antiporter